MFLGHINDNIHKEHSGYILSEQNMEIIKKSKFLDVNDKENIINFFSVLGKSDLNGQISNCKTYKEIFNNTLKNLENNEQSDCKSTGTLIVCFGFFIIILII